MKQAALKNFDLTWVPITGLVIFVVCFAAYTYWTYKRSNKDFYEKAASIPLENNHERI